MTEANISNTLSDILQILKETKQEIADLSKKIDAAVLNLSNLVQIARNKPKSS
jgi:hypothetical protein